MATSTKARTLTVDRVAMRFASPLRITGYVFEAMPSVVATVGSAGLEGRGEAAGVYYLGDDQDRMVATIEEIRGAVEGGAGRSELQALLPPCGGRNALDCALWDYEAKRSGIATAALAGVGPLRPLTTACRQALVAACNSPLHP